MPVTANRTLVFSLVEAGCDFIRLPAFKLLLTFAGAVFPLAPLIKATPTAAHVIGLGLVLLLA